LEHPQELHHERRIQVISLFIRHRSKWQQTLARTCGSIFLLAAVLTQTAHAIVDANQNGISDLWEKIHNNGSLFANIDPQADPDGDGWKNAQEAIAGTPLHDGSFPMGLVQTHITHIPATYLTPEEEGGEPVLITPEAVTITWPTLAGKRYSLLVSTDLSADSWIPLGSSLAGDGTEMGKGIPLTQPDGTVPPSLFWRVAVEDMDTDGDSLTDFEEHQIGSSIYFADTDDDGEDDATTYASGGNPSGADSDNDGVPDKAFYTVEFEIKHEERQMIHPLGYEVFIGKDDEHRYQKQTITEEYSIKSSPRYDGISDGKHEYVSSYLEEGESPGFPAIVESGTTLLKWKNDHTKSLDEGESLELSPSTTTVTSEQDLKETETTVTTSTPWKVKKREKGEEEDTVVRSGKEEIVHTFRNTLSEEETYQSMWQKYFLTEEWREEQKESFLMGPLNRKEHNRLYNGDSWAAEVVRNYFHYQSFGATGTISSPGRSFLDQGGNYRLKSLRWRWVKLDPNNPFTLAGATPPAGYQQDFSFLIRKRNFLQRPGVPMEEENFVLGTVEIQCKASAGGGWHEIDIDEFAGYKLDEPECHEDLNFANYGSSSVWFENLPVKAQMGDVAGTQNAKPGFLTAEARPKPSVEMSVTSATVAGGSLKIRVQGTVSDAVSYFASSAGERPQQLKFFHQDEFLRAISIGSSVGEGGFVFDETLTLPDARPQAYVIRAVTSENVSGTTGYDEVAVSLVWKDTTPTAGGAVPPPVKLEASHYELRGTPRSGIEPTTLRLPNVSQSLVDAGLKVVSGEAVYKIIAKNDAWFPEDPHKPGEIKYFLPSSHPVPARLDAPGYDAETGLMKFALRYPEMDEDIQLEDVHVVPCEDSEEGLGGPAVAARGITASGGSTSSSASNTPPPWSPGNPVTPNHVIWAYRFLNANDTFAEELLNGYLRGGHKIVTGDYARNLTTSVDWGSDWSSYEDNIRTIFVEEDINPVEAARLLFEGLKEMYLYNEVADDFEWEDPMDEVGAFQIAAAVAVEKTKGTAVAATELYLSGLGIANEGLDWIMVVNDVSEGHYESAAAALPFVPVGLVKAGGSITMVTVAGAVLMTLDREAFLVLRQFGLSGKLATAGTVYDEYSYAVFLRHVLSSDSGPIAVPLEGQHGQLKSAMLKMQDGYPKPTGGTFDAHHDFPWAHREWFANHGIDVNDPAYGRWVATDIHGQWHGNRGGQFNAWWGEWIEQEKNVMSQRGHPYTMQEIFQKLIDCRQEFPDKP